MKKLLSFLTMSLILASSAWAASKTVTLSVPDMKCAACPITVKKSLLQVNGVSKTNVSMEKHIAIVTFDDTKTNIQALTAATTNAGYPSSVKE